MSIETILAKLGLTDEEAREFVTHYNREYFDKCSLSVSLSGDCDYEGDSTYANINVSLTLEDPEGTTLFTSNESCSFSLS